MVSVAVWHCVSTAQRSFEAIFHSWFIHWASMKFLCRWQHKFLRNITCKIPSQGNVVSEIRNFFKSKLGRLKWHLSNYRFPKLIIPKVRATNSGQIEAIINMTQDWCLSNGVIVRFLKINWVLALKAPCTTLRHERLPVKMKLANNLVKYGPPNHISIHKCGPPELPKSKHELGFVEENWYFLTPLSANAPPWVAVSGRHLYYNRCWWFLDPRGDHTLPSPLWPPAVPPPFFPVLIDDKLWPTLKKFQRNCFFY